MNITVAWRFFNFKIKKLIKNLKLKCLGSLSDWGKCACCYWVWRANVSSQPWYLPALLQQGNNWEFFLTVLCEGEEFPLWLIYLPIIALQILIKAVWPQIYSEVLSSGNKTSVRVGIELQLWWQLSYSWYSLFCQWCADTSIHIATAIAKQ